MGLLGLMLLQESRRAARSTPEGDLILLDHQNRSLWNRDQIAEGISLTESALASRRFGAYTLQAAIAAVHAEASIAGIHGLAQIKATLPPAASHPAVSGCGTQSRRCRRHVRGAGAGPSPYRRPARHVANSPTTILRTPPGRNCAAGWDGFRRRVTSYEKALSLVRREPERRFLAGRLRELK